MRISTGLAIQSLVAAMALASSSTSRAQAASYTSTIEVIEVWANGNVAFRLDGVSSTCATGNWFVINKSSPGMKNFYAAVLTAKSTDHPIRVSTSGCAPAENYNTTPYIQIDYLY